ncbi:uncharacterized protein N7496_010566 [Penicillium cataractarum]|uniref:Transcription factor domain-containing protein n=1 Tax=Penicillium cataractarum TaxID=2100454 RepID=A0A9W9V107_9EURO|nr:uncharacterized protein N7496_010566 [Penicillium cataractarum]KAJ5364853.1 hypothetical protein N7496_010566 [Penicillium cataractarum]
MRSHANQALTAALDLSLHSLDETSTEAERRTWWTAMLVSYLSSIDHQAPWSLFLEAEQGLMSVPELLNETSGDLLMSNSSSDSPAEITRIQSHLSSLIKKSNLLSRLPCKEGPDAFALRNMLSISTLFIHCARIRLHRARAFMDIPMFLRKYCDLSGIEDQGTSTVTSMYSDDRDSNFPFTKEESSLTCLKSALAISRGIESLTQAPSSPDLSQWANVDNAAMTDDPVAALVSGNLASCHYLLNNPEADSEIQDTERSMREIRHGLQSILGSMRAAQMFEGVDSMMREVHIACKLAFGAFNSDS